MAKEENRILITGGGIGGLALGAGLEKSGLDYVIFESASQSPDAGGLKLWPNALRALDALGISGMEQKGSVIKRGYVKSYKNELLKEIFLEKTGHGLPIISAARKEILDLLLSYVPPNRIVYGREIASVATDASGVTVRFADGSSEKGAVLVGADGVNSVVRRELFGQEKMVYTGRISWRGLIRVQDGFPCAEGDSREIFGDGKRMGFAHMGKGLLGWYAPVNHQNPDFEPENARSYLLEIFRGWPAEVAEIIQRTPAEEIIRSPIYYRDFNEKWGDGRVTLLGDAAHAMSPDLAQGACQALEDAAVLCESLVQNNTGPQALRDYENRRVKRAGEVARQSAKIGKMSNRAGAFNTWLREKMWKYMPEKVAREGLEKIVNVEFLKIPE